MGETILSPEKEKRVKIGMWILIIGGAFILLLVIFQYPKYLNLPFAKYGQSKGLWKSAAEKEAEALQVLKTTDTDSDGLVDFDETYTYGTSPYLADSDSDGFNDKQEVESGNDPNCPAGTTCSKISEGAAGPAVNVGGATGGISNISGLLSGQATAEEIRTALRQAGMSDDYLSKLDDETLLKLYQETIKESGGAVGVNTNTNMNTAVSEGGEMTAEELREILRQNGVDETTLKNVSDEELLKLYQESLKQ
jgi:hypothetical protein